MGVLVYLYVVGIALLKTMSLHANRFSSLILKLKASFVFGVFDEDDENGDEFLGFLH